MASRGGRLSCDRLSRGLVVAAFVLVPLVVAPALAQPFTSAKAHLVTGTAVAWLLEERFLCASRGLPRFVVGTWPALVALGAWIAFGALRQGPGWGMQPLLALAAFVVLALASFWHFRRAQLELVWLRAATIVPLAVVVALGLAQFAGLDLLSGLPGGDHRSATFGNVNMAAQFAGLGLVVVLAIAPVRPPSSSSRPARLLTSLLAGAVLAYVWLAGTRSVWLSLAAALVVLVAGRRVTGAHVLGAAAAAVLVAGAVLRFAATPAAPLPPGHESKRASAAWRLAVWRDTVDLIRDHPLGVGAGNFEDAFVPYALSGRSRPGEHLVFRSPHNEYLRLVAEEGVPAAVLLLAGVGALVRQLLRSSAIGSWRSPPGVLLAAVASFLAVEAFFQFPFEMAFPTLLTAVLLGLALACLERGNASESSLAEPAAGRGPRAGDVVCLVLSLGMVIVLFRLASAELLSAGHRDDVTALERACRLDPRRLEACVRAAWLHSRAGEHEEARRGIAEVLRRSPHYFPALKLLGEDMLAAGEQAGGCQRLRSYDEMFGKDSSVHELVVRSCPQPAP